MTENSPIRLDKEALKEAATSGKPFAILAGGQLNTAPSVGNGTWKPCELSPKEITKKPGVYRVADGKLQRWEPETEIKPKKGSTKGVPRSTVGPVTSKGFSQNNHMWWMKKDPELTAYDFGVGMNLHMIAYTKGNGGKAKASPDHLAAITRLGIDAAKARVRTLVERGWFQRIDNGKGGRDSRNVATYVPTVPEYVLARGGN